jgi:hypothetical protein
MSKNNEIADTIIAMEKAALVRWGKGDPSGFLEISGEEVVYFDPYQALRIDGLAALSAYYETIRGQVYFDRFELLNPKVQQVDGMVVLTFNYSSFTGENQSRWNCTEVYQLIGEQWRIIQTHWSKTQPCK